MNTSPNATHPILVVDDNPEIHTDFRKLLEPSEAPSELDAMDAELFGEKTPSKEMGAVRLTCASQGQEAIELVRAARANGTPFVVAFLDVRMPPGIDGVETAKQLLALDPELQIVICSAFADYSWSQMVAALGENDRWIVLRKPFEPIEVRQMALALREKWILGRRAALRAEELERMVKDRTEALERALNDLIAEMRRRERMEASVRVSQKLEAVGRLAGGVAHHLNTPIQYAASDLDFLDAAYTSLTDLVQHLRAHTAEERETSRADKLARMVPDSLANVRSGLTEVSKVVRALAEFAQPGDVGFAPIDINRTLENMAELTKPDYEGVAKLELSLGEIPEIYGRHGELNQVFYALLINAVQAIEDADSESGTIRIETRLHGDTVEVSFRDDGCGIDEEDKPKIFSPFFTTKDVQRGRGLSLSVAKSVVEQHGGTLTFASVEGEGSRFEVRLKTGMKEDDEY